MTNYNIPKFVIKLHSQKGKYTFKEIISPKTLEEICFLKTGKKKYSVEFITEGYNKGQLALLYNNNDVHFISFSPTGKIGRNSFFQSLSTAVIRFIKEKKTNEHIKDISFYFLDFFGNVDTPYYKFMFRIMKTIGFNFINFEKIFSEDFLPFNTVEDIIFSRNTNKRKQNNSTYITKNEKGHAEIYAKTYGANKKEAVLLALAISRISEKLTIYEITEKELQVLPQPDKDVLLEVGNIVFVTTNLNMERANFNNNKINLRSPIYISNLLEKLGDKKCTFCNCEIPELIEGAHILEVSQIKQRRNLSFEDKFKFAIDGNNGLWLCRNHHKMFDENIIYIDNDSSINLKENLRKEYADYIREHTKIWTVPSETYTAEFKFYLEQRYAIKA